MLCDDEASTSSRRSRPIATSSLSRETSSPQPGTSRDLYAPTEVQHRARSPSLHIPVITEDIQLPPMARAETPAVIISDDERIDEADDVMFVGVLRPPHAELLLLLAQQVLYEILEINNTLPASINAGLRTRVFESEKMNGQTDRRICIPYFPDYKPLLFSHALNLAA